MRLDLEQTYFLMTSLVSSATYKNFMQIIRLIDGLDVILMSNKRWAARMY